MDHSLAHDQLDADPPLPSGTAEFPVDGILCDTTKIHPTQSEYYAPVTRASSRTRRHSTPSHSPPCHRIPTEILITIFQLATLSRTREDLYALLDLTHVCRFWRSSLIHYPRAWTTIFATHKDHRGFVEMCLERSQPLPLEVTVDTRDKGRVPAGCDCDENESGRLTPNEKTPCEWHFVFETLAHPKNSKRIQLLNADSSIAVFRRALEFGSCRFFSSPFPQLTTLIWKDIGMEGSHRLFPDTRSLPNLRSVTFKGRWHHSLARVHNLTTFIIERFGWCVDAEIFRLFVSNNRSLESLELHVSFGGSTKGLPIDLLNLKSLSVSSRPKVLSRVIRVPAFERLSSLWISLEDEVGDWHTLRATGDGISLTAKSWVGNVAEDWKHLTEFTKPTIRRVRIYDQQPVDCFPYGDLSTKVMALVVELDVHTLDIGLTYSGCWGDGLWTGLKELGSQLKTIRFEITERGLPFRGGRILNKIADLVEHRFREGRALSVVERMVVSKDEQVNQLHDRLWRRFWNDRRIGEYLASV